MSKVIKTVKSYCDIIAENFSDHLNNIPQIFRLSIADLKKTYHGAALGWAWAIIKPVFTIFVYWFAIEIGLRKGGDVDGYPYILWLTAGVIPWFYMSSCITGGTDCIRRYSYLVTKMKYPVSTIPTFTNLSKLFVHILTEVLVIIFFWIYGYAPTVFILQMPVYTILMFLFFNSWSLFSGLVSAISKDFSNLVKSLNVAVFWLSGILWNRQNVQDNKIIRIFLNLNPVTYICYGYRNCLIEHKWFFQEPKRLGYFLIFYAILGLLSIWAYKKLRKEIPDVL